MIDWNRSIELLDGTPVVIKFGPDRDGHYCIRKVNRGLFTKSQMPECEGLDNAWLNPDGGVIGKYRTPRIRNVASSPNERDQTAILNDTRVLENIAERFGTTIQTLRRKFT